MTLKDLLTTYEKALNDTYLPFNTYTSGTLYERFLKPFLTLLGWNPDRWEHQEGATPKITLHASTGKIAFYYAAPSEESRFQLGRTNAQIDSVLNEYLFAVVSTFTSTFIWFQGKEVYAVGIERLEEEWDQVQRLLSCDAVETDVAIAELRRLAERDYDERFLQELNLLRLKVAEDILSVKTNLPIFKQNGEWDTDKLNEVVIRLITRFLAIRLAEDVGLPTPARLADLRRAFRLYSGKAVLVNKNPLGRDSLLASVIRLVNEFDLLYNGGIFTYHDPTDRINLPDSALMCLLDFMCGWRLPKEFTRLIGFTYEKFLAQALKVESRRRKLEVSLQPITAAYTRRRTQAIYYTRRPIVNFIGEATLGEWLKEKAAKLEKAVENFDISGFVITLREVKSIKALDPACGSGSFLLKLLELFRDFYKRVTKLAEQLEGKFQEFERSRRRSLIVDDPELLVKMEQMDILRREIGELRYPGIFALKNNLYGVDFDRKAIDIAAFTLMVGVYDELQQGAKCPALIGENLKVGNSLVSPIIADPSAFASSETEVAEIEEAFTEGEGEEAEELRPPFPEDFTVRAELPNCYRDAIARLIALRQTMARLADMSDDELKQLIMERYERLKAVYPHIRKRYPNALPPELRKRLDEWHESVDSEPPEKAAEFFIQAKIAASLLRFAFLAEEQEILEPISAELRKPLVRFFNSERKVLGKRAWEKILADSERLAHELRYSSNAEDSLAELISPNQPPKAFLWELEFPEVFFNLDGSFKENSGFHIIVGNPPYGRIKEIQDRAEKTVLSKFFGGTFALRQGNINYYKLFLERCWFLLCDGGRFGMIFPTPFNGEAHSTKLRRTFFEYGQIHYILQFPKQARVFGQEVLQDVSIWVHRKELTNADYTFKLRTNIQEHELLQLTELPFVEVHRNQVVTLTGNTYRIPALVDPEREWALLMKLAKLPKLNGLVKIGEGHLHETNDAKYMSTDPTGNLLVRGMHIKRYFIDLSTEGWRTPRWVDLEGFLKAKPTAKAVIEAAPKLVCREMLYPYESHKLNWAWLEEKCVLGNSIRYLLPNSADLNLCYLLGLLNSNLLEWFFCKFSFTYHIKPYELEALPFVVGTDEQVQKVCELVDTIMEKKKRLYELRTDLADFVKLEELPSVPLEKWLLTFAIDECSLYLEPVATDKTEAIRRLRARTDGDRLALEYAIPMENSPIVTEEVEEVSNEEAQPAEAYPVMERIGRTWYEWKFLASGSVKDPLAAQFLCDYLRRVNRFSTAKRKTLWQKVGEIPIPIWISELKEAVQQWQEALTEARSLQAEIDQIDRAIDRIVYTIYGLTEEEIAVVENALNLTALPTIDDAIKLTY